MSQPFVAAAVGLRIPQESQIEGCKHQDNSDVHHQAFPELIPEEEQIYTDDNTYQHRNVKHDNQALCHINHQDGWTATAMLWRVLVPGALS